MNRLRLLLMRKKPTMLDFVAPKMSKEARVVFMVSLDDARKEQAKTLKRAKALSK